MNVGQKGEDLACSYLERRGYRILERNYRCLYGEIDILCSRGSVLICVEVKTRRSSTAGEPYEAVSRYKKYKIYRAGMYYIRIRSPQTQRMQIDVISLHVYSNGTLQQLKHFKNITF